MNAKTIEAARIAGAKSCLDVIVNRKLFKPVPRHNFEENRAKFDGDMATLLAAVGELPPRALGAISLLAELIAGEIDCGNFKLQYLEDWRAEATMTPSEIVRHRANVKAEGWCEDEAPARRSVILLATRRAAQ